MKNAVKVMFMVLIVLLIGTIVGQKVFAKEDGTIQTFWEWIIYGAQLVVGEHDQASQAHGFSFSEDGRVGIGTTSPLSHLHVNSSTGGAGIRIVGQAGTYEDTASLTLASAEPEKKMWILTHKSNNELLYQYNNGPGTGWIFPLVLSSEGNVGIGTRNPQEKLDVAGMTRTQVLRITGGSDIAEPFNIKEPENIKPGMVLSIAPDNPGKLMLSDKAYDRCVAGIASGAGGIKPGITLTQEGSFDGTHNVALTGRVYGLCDASHGSIEPGDLLTTSPKPGYAMKVNDYEKAQGAVLGKAMTRLDKGEGLVLVLVTLQ